MHEAVSEVAVEQDGVTTLPCAVAFDLSERLAVPLTEIRAVCDEHGIKITTCQLGCFA